MPSEKIRKVERLEQQGNIYAKIFKEFTLLKTYLKHLFGISKLSSEEILYRYIIALAIYKLGGRVETEYFEDTPENSFKSLATALWNAIMQDPLLTELTKIVFPRIKNQTSWFGELVKRKLLRIQDYGLYTIGTLREPDNTIKLVAELNRHFEVFLKERIKRYTYTAAVHLRLLGTKNVNEEIKEIDVVNKDLIPAPEEKKGEDRKPIPIEKRPKILSPTVSFLNALLDSSYVIISADEEAVARHPILRYLKSKARSGWKEDVFFIIIDLDRLKRWALESKIYKIFPLYSKYSDEEGALQYVTSRLENFFRHNDEITFFRVVSFAINKILEYLYQGMINLGVIPPDVKFQDFVSYVFALGPDNELFEAVYSALKNPAFVIILPKELLETADRYSTLKIVKNGYFFRKGSDLVSHGFYLAKCKECGKYFIWTDFKTSNNEKPVIKCPFCGSINTELIYTDPFITLSYDPYMRIDAPSADEFLVPTLVSEILEETIEAERLPFLLISYPLKEKRRGVPFGKEIPVFIGFFDVELTESEEVLNENYEKALQKLSQVKDPLQRLRILAKSVNLASSTKKLIYVDYAIAAHLITLATATNKKIYIKQYGTDVLDELTIKPSINLLNVGESGAAKSTIKEKLQALFPEKVVVNLLYQYTSRQLSGYVSLTKPRKSILIGMNDKMLIFEEATYAREADVYGVLRDPLESGKIDRYTINTAIEFIMNDPLNVNIGSVKGFHDLRIANKVAATLLRRYGSFHSILKGLYSYMLLGVLSIAFTKAFIERMRMFIIAREYSKVYIDIDKAVREYNREIEELLEKNLLLSSRELRALFTKAIFPITTIIVPEDVYARALQYAKYFSRIFTAIGEKLDAEVDVGNVQFISNFNFAIDRITNSLILIASGIAKLTRFEDAQPMNEEYVIELTPQDIELAKYFFIVFSPDLVHELAMKQLDEAIKYIKMLEEQHSGISFKVEYDVLENVVSQVATPELISKQEEAVIPLREIARVVREVIMKSFEEEKSIYDLVEPTIKAMLGSIPNLDKLKEEIIQIIFALADRDIIRIDTTSKVGWVYDIVRRDILSSLTKLSEIISEIRTSH